MAAFVAELFAVGVPHLDIRELVRSADVVVIADVSEKLSTGTTDVLTIRGREFASWQYASHLIVKATLKGTCAPEITVTYSLPLQFMGYVPLRPGIRMVFLRRNRNIYMPTDPYYPDLPATDLATSTIYPSSDDAVVSTVVFHELANVIASPGAPTSAKLELLQKDYALPTSDYFISALKEGIVHAENEQFKAYLQAQLISRGELGELPEVVDSLAQKALDAAGKYALLYAIGNHIRDARAVPILLPLLRSTDPQTRVAIAEALWHIADSHTMKPMLRALSDSERDVRYYAVRALADITGQQLWGPSIPEFQEHEAKYIQHWKQWAAENGQDLMP